MKTACLAACSIAALLTLNGVSSASMINGTNFVVSKTGTIDIQFLSQNSSSRGKLYFLGSSAAGGPITYATSTDANSLGRYLFNSHTSTLNSTVRIGEFVEGTVLHFAYKLYRTSGYRPSNTVFRTDIAADRNYFNFQKLSSGSSSSVFTKMRIEDDRGNDCDWDYDDLCFKITNAPKVPAPGAVTLAGLAGLLAVPRRRREA